MSLHRHRQAMRVVNVPAADFEKLIESDPPTVTALADMGKRPGTPRPSSRLAAVRAVWRTLMDRLRATNAYDASAFAAEVRADLDELLGKLVEHDE